jgi:pyruvate formate lyase activating enzyme
MDCVDACLNGALEATGDRLTVEEVVNEACKDELFYSNSGGGVTLSGGEPLLQAEFACRLLKVCKERGLQTALDTCGHASWDALQKALEYTDLVLFDLKHLDPEKHLKGTRVGNDIILENLKKTVQSNKARIWIRIPVIKDYNDSKEHFQKIATVLKEIPVEKVSLLAYHEWGKAKYTALGREYPHNSNGALDKERLNPLKEILEAAGIKVTIDH